MKTCSSLNWYYSYQKQILYEIGIIFDGTYVSNVHCMSEDGDVPSVIRFL
jgi:hypothetical protein